MGNVSKGLITFAIVILVIGIVMAISGIILGGRLDDLNFINKVSTININEEYQDINSLELNLKYGEIKIKNGETFKIEGIVPDNISFESSVKNGKWTINDNKKNKIVMLWSGFSSNNYDVTIYIPSNTVLDEININIGACKLDMDELIANSVKINVGAGSLNVNKINAKSAKINCGAGKVSINSATLSKSEIECGVGSININLNGKQDAYNYDITTGIGSINIGDNTYSGFGSTRTIENVNSDNRIKLDCGVGSINVEFKEE